MQIIILDKKEFEDKEDEKHNITQYGCFYKNGDGLGNADGWGWNGQGSGSGFSDGKGYRTFTGSGYGTNSKNSVTIELKRIIILDEIEFLKNLKTCNCDQIDGRGLADGVPFLFINNRAYGEGFGNAEGYGDSFGSGRGYPCPKIEGK